ncbi:MAG: hypothetical protein HYY30_11835 [Chloroflexi bacterium]|nr:hypothetical protein [Chloroflexota bacterium]
MNTLRVKQESSPGVIDTLSVGFGTVNKIAWIVLLPVALDFLLWRGPQLSIATFLQNMLAWYNSVVTAEMGQGMGTSINADAAASIEQLQQTLEAGIGQVNLVRMLGSGGVLAGLVPSVPSLPSLPSLGVATEVTQPLWIAASSVGLGLLGLLLGCVYFGLVAQQIRDGHVSPAKLGRNIWRYWLSALGFIGLLIGLVLFAGLPTGLFLSAAFFVSPTAGLILSSLVALVLQLGAIMILLYLFFVADAIVISEAGPFRAVALSAKVVARNFWAAMGLVLLVLVISIGTQEIWRYLAAEPWGPLAGIAGNGYIASGLTAARMTFYKTRVANIQEGKPAGVGRGNG